MTGIIYKLTIGNYFYYGRTVQRFKTRMGQHKKSCFNRSKKSYWTLKYVKMRELGVKKETYDDMVKQQIVYNCPLLLLDCYEYMIIPNGNPWCLNVINKESYEIYEKDISRDNVLTPEQRKINIKISTDKSKAKRRANGKSKISKDKYNTKRKENGKQKKWNDRNNKKKYFCECCQKEMLDRKKYSHWKSTNHSTNLMMWID